MKQIELNLKQKQNRNIAEKVPNQKEWLWNMNKSFLFVTGSEAISHTLYFIDCTNENLRFEKKDVGFRFHIWSSRIL